MKPIDHQNSCGDQSTSGTNGAQELPEMPLDAAEACKLFGLKRSASSSVKLKAIARVANVFFRASELILSDAER